MQDKDPVEFEEIVPQITLEDLGFGGNGGDEGGGSVASLLQKIQTGEGDMTELLQELVGHEMVELSPEEYQEAVASSPDPGTPQ